MTREERIQEQLADLQRGLDSITIDAFDFAKEYCGDTYSIKDSWFRRIYHDRLDWCRHYIMKTKDGVRYRLCTIDDMVSYYTKQAIRRGL